MVILCTARLKIKKNSTVHSAHRARYVSRVVIRTNTIISLYSINRMMFGTETDCVYCAVRTPYLNIVNVISPFKGLAYILSICEVGEPASLWEK